MSVEPAISPRIGPLQPPWALIPVTLALACALLIAGSAGLLPPLAALAAAVAASTAVHSGLLVRLAVSTHLRQPGPRACRGAGLLGLSLLVTGLTVVGAVAIAAGTTATGTNLAGTIAAGTARTASAAAGPAGHGPLLDLLAARMCAAGLLVATALFLLGLLLLPGTAPGPLDWLRRLLDVATIGSCLLYSAWLMVLRPPAGAHGLAVGVVLMGCAGLAIAVVTGLRAVSYRPAVLACGAGAVLSMTGLCATVALFEGDASSCGLPLAAAALVFGPVLCWAGARNATSDRAPAPALRPSADPGFAGYPILAVPVGTVLAATGYRLVDGPPFDTTSVALGLTVFVALAVRNFFALLDVRRYARGVAAEEARYRSLVTGSADVTVVLDNRLVVTWQSPAATRHFGLTDQEVLDHPLTALMHPDDVAPVRERLAALLAGNDDAPAPTGQRGAAAHDGPPPPARPGDAIPPVRPGEPTPPRRPGEPTTAPRPGDPAAPTLLSARLRDGSGRWRDTESTISDQRAVPEVGALVVHVRDVGERRELERALRRMAFTDQLTELANRRQLLRTVAAMRAVPGQPGALLMISLDGLSQAGHARGREIDDAVLIEVARRLRGAVDASDLPARVSGTELAVATANHPVRAYALAHRVLAELHRPYQLPGATVQIEVAVGLAELAGASSVTDVLAHAGLALRRARQLPQGRVEWYDEALEADLLRRSSLEEELPGVVDRGELDLVFQPILDLFEEVPVGAEALLRWRHPRRGTVLAADFVPVAEDLGLIDEIGEWVLQHACRQLAGWLRDGLDLWLSVNLAARQLAAPNLVARVGRVLDTHQIPPERLVLEVTEQGLGADLPRAVAALAGLRELGVRTALAGFGTGAAPLALLRRLPVDVLKVDRALFAGPAGRPGTGTPLIDVVVGLGRRLGLEIVAEGLENEVHLDLVRTGGCRYGQGFLFGRPEPAEHFEAYLESHRTPTT